MNNIVRVGKDHVDYTVYEHYYWRHDCCRLDGDPLLTLHHPSHMIVVTFTRIFSEYQCAFHLFYCKLKAFSSDARQDKNLLIVEFIVRY